MEEAADLQTRLRESMSVLGLIPAIIRFAGQQYSAAVRLQAASLARHFCSTDTKQFIACGGANVLVSFLQVGCTCICFSTLMSHLFANLTNLVTGGHR